MTKIKFLALVFLLFSTTSIFGETIWLKSKKKRNYGQYYSIDNAATNLQNQASLKKPEGCGSSYKAKIIWERPICSPYKKKQFECTIAAKVECQSRSCQKSFCGTEHGWKTFLKVK
jgi:hypothetical protein